jgi:hypothetical protein
MTPTRSLFDDLARSLGAPGWIKPNAVIWVREPGEGCPYKTRGPLRVTSLVVAPFSVLGRPSEEMYAFPAARIDHHHSDGGEYTDFGGNSNGSSWYTSSSWFEVLPTDNLYRTEREARGGWPLAGDRVVCALPEGRLETVIVRLFESNGAPMIEVTGGRNLSLGCVVDPMVRA